MKGASGGPRTPGPLTAARGAGEEASGGPPLPGDYDLLKPFLSQERIARLEEVLAERTDRIVLVAENLYDPHNLSAILRTADAFGIQRVILAGSSPDQLNPLVALGSERWLTVERAPDSAACLAALKERGLTVAGTALSAGAEDPASWEPEGPVALVLGSEHSGLSPAFLEGADILLRLPLCGFARSLNVSVAAGVLLWALTRKRALSGRGLPADEAQALRERWARLSVAKSEAILRRLRGRGRGEPEGG